MEKRKVNVFSELGVYILGCLASSSPVSLEESVYLQTPKAVFFSLWQTAGIPESTNKDQATLSLGCVIAFLKSRCPRSLLQTHRHTHSGVPANVCNTAGKCDLISLWHKPNKNHHGNRLLDRSAREFLDWIKRSGKTHSDCG